MKSSAQSALRWVDANPYATLLWPPALSVIQFLLMLRLLALKFPKHVAADKVQVSLLLFAICGLTFSCLVGAALGVRQVLMLKKKILPLLGIFANAGYLIGFMLFFL